MIVLTEDVVMTLAVWIPYEDILQECVVTSSHYREVVSKALFFLFALVLKVY